MVIGEFSTSPAASSIQGIPNPDRTRRALWRQQLQRERRTEQLIYRDRPDECSCRRRPEQVTAYLNGTEVAGGKASAGFDLGSGQLRFFRDNTIRPATPRARSQTGAVSCVLVYDGTLTAGEVSQVAGDPTLCPAARPSPGRAEASVTGEAEGDQLEGLDGGEYGLTVSCPIGTTRCPAVGRVSAAPTRAHGKPLGVVQFAGPSRREHERTGALAKAGNEGLACRRDAPRSGSRLRSRPTGEQPGPGPGQEGSWLPGPPPFRPGKYTGATSQDLPDLDHRKPDGGPIGCFPLARDPCGDGKAHANAVILRGRARVAATGASPWRLTSTVGAQPG